VSGAWLGARLHFREGSRPLVTSQVRTGLRCCATAWRGFSMSPASSALGTSVAKLHADGERVHEVELDSGERSRGLGREQHPHRGLPRPRPRRRHAAASGDPLQRPAVDGVRLEEAVGPDFYWMTSQTSTARRAVSSCSTLSIPRSARRPVVRQLRHALNSRTRPFFTSPKRKSSGYLQDFRAVFGFDLDPFWVKLSRIPMYSPIITRSYRNPPVRSARFGISTSRHYRTFPSVISTGTALASGLEAARALLRDRGTDTPLPDEVAAFRR